MKKTLPRQHADLGKTELSRWCNLVDVRFRNRALQNLVKAFNDACDREDGELTQALVLTGKIRVIPDLPTDD